MRMWMINPAYMCNRHLLGEHVELHMLVGHLKRKRNLGKYITNNLIEPLSIFKRHDQLVEEMLLRNFQHKSPIVYTELLDHLPDKEKRYKINQVAAFKDLMNRCYACRYQTLHYEDMYQKEMMK